MIEAEIEGLSVLGRLGTKLMGKKKRGRIINIASVVGQVGNAGQANYSAAKVRLSCTQCRSELGLAHD